MKTACIQIVILLLELMTIKVIAQPSKHAASNIISTSFARAKSAFDQEDFARAIILFKQCQTNYQAQKDWEKVVFCHNRLADSYYYLNQPTQRLQAASQAVTYARQYLPKTNPERAEAWKGKGDAFFALAKPDSALYYLREAKDLFAALSNPSQHVACTIGLAACYYYMGQFKNMEASLKQALTLAKQKLPSDNDTFSTIFQLYGVLYQQTGNFERGLQNALMALDFHVKTPRQDTVALANEYNLIGLLYNEKGDWDNAYAFFQQAQQLYLHKNKQHQNLIDVYTNIGLYWLSQENYPEAIASLRKGWQLAQKNDLSLVKSKLSACLNTLVTCYVKTNVLDSARYFLQRITQYQLNNAHSFQNLSAVYLQQKSYTQALVAIKKAVQIATTQNSPRHPLLGKIYTHYGQIYLAANKPQAAIRCYDQALDILTAGHNEEVFRKKILLERVNAKVALLTTLQLKAEALTTQNKKEGLIQALRLYEYATQVIDILRLSSQAEDSKIHLAKIATPIYEKATEVAYALYQQTRQVQYLETIFLYSEKNKAILLLDALREHSLKEEALIPIPLLRLEQALIRDKSFYQRKLTEEEIRPRQDSQKMQDWQNHLFLIRKQHDSLVTVFEHNYPKYYQLKYNYQPVTLAIIRAQLLSNKRTSLLTYFVGEKSLFCIGVHAGGLSVHRIVKNARFLATFQRFRKSFSLSSIFNSTDSAFVHYTTDAYALFQTLVAPVLPSALLENSHLIILPSDLLGYIPFEALLVKPPHNTTTTNYSPANLSYLIQHSTVSYGFSAYWLLFDRIQQHPKSNTPLKTFAGFAPSFHHASSSMNVGTCVNGKLSELRCTQAEVTDISQLLQGEAFVNRQASKEQFLTEASQYRILHLATHACLDEQQPMMSRLFFSNGSLTASELYHQPLHAHLVVLSACNSGIGKSVTGEGLMSLSRAFAYAGAPSLVMSLWSVDDCSTAAIMKLFYEHLSRQLPKDEALRMAKLEYLQQSRSHHMHPFFWAAFIQLGDPSPMTDTGTNKITYLFIFLGLLGILVLWLVIKRLWLPKSTS